MLAHPSGSAWPNLSFEARLLRRIYRWLVRDDLAAKKPFAEEWAYCPDIKDFRM